MGVLDNSSEQENGFGMAHERTIKRVTSFENRMVTSEIVRNGWTMGSRDQEGSSGML